MTQVFQKAMQLLIGTDEPFVYRAQHSHNGLSKKAKTRQPRPLKKLTERELIQLESDIGARLFGEIPDGHRREFFNLDPATWIWYDESVETYTRRHKSTTVRYEVHDNGILKVQEGARYCFIEGQELNNFVMATQLYYERVCREVYQRQPHPSLVGMR